MLKSTIQSEIKDNNKKYYIIQRIIYKTIKILNIIIQNNHFKIFIVQQVLQNTAEIAQFNLISNNPDNIVYIIDQQSRLDLQIQFVNNTLFTNYTIDTRQNTSNFITDNQLTQCENNIYHNCYIYIDQITDSQNWNIIQQQIETIQNSLQDNYQIIYTKKNVFASGLLSTALLFGLVCLIYLGVSWYPNAITEDPIEMPKKTIE